MFFIRYYHIVANDASLAPEYTTLEAVKAFGALHIAISTLNSISTALFDGQRVKETVDAKVSWKILKISTSRNLNLFPTFRACDDIVAATRSKNPVQTLQAKDM